MDICVDDSREWEACGVLMSGLTTRVCVIGRWGEWSECDEPRYVELAAGIFVMGSPEEETGRGSNEGPQHEVLLTRRFTLKATEVTQGEWWGVMGSNPSSFDECGLNCPVERVSWWSTLVYVNALSARAGLRSCFAVAGCQGDAAMGTLSCERVSVVDGATPYECEGFRLPTEAEWEYAARAGTTEARYGALNIIAWYSGNAERRTHPVGQKRPNGWGLYDMLGNVWEWTYDKYGSNSYAGPAPISNPTGPAGGGYRVLRGGGWSFTASYLRAANRYSNAPAYRFYYVGFRPARSLP